MKWADLSPKQKAIGLKRWHAKQGAQLTPEASKALAQKQALAQEVAPGLTKGDLLAQVRSGTRQKFGESEAALGDQFRQNQLQTARTGDWFGQYRSAINQAAKQQAAQNQAAVQGVQNLQQGLNADSQQQWAGQNAQMTADAANRGATASPQLADQAHNASNIRGMLTGSYGAMLLNQGNSQQTDLSNRAATSVQQRNEALAGKQTERAGLQRDRTRLKQQKGDFKVTYAQQLKSDASDSALKQALTKAQIGDTNAKTANTNATTTKTKVETKKTALENAYFQKYGKYPPTGTQPLNALEKYRLNYAKTHGGKFPGTESTPSAGNTKDQFGNTPKDIERYTNYWDRAKVQARQYAAPYIDKQGVKHPASSDPGEVARLIIETDSTIPPWMARAAAQQIILGYVGPGNQTNLKRHGVKKGYGHKPATAGTGGTGVTGSTNAGGN